MQHALVRDTNRLRRLAAALAFSDGLIHPVFWTATRAMHDLGVPGDTWGMNRLSEVVGEAYFNNDFYGAHAFIWSATTGMRDLGICHQ